MYDSYPERPLGSPKAERLRGPGVLAYESPEHQEHSEALQDRQEEEERPDAAHGRAPEEDRVENDLESEERPQLSHSRIRRPVERKPPLTPPKGEHGDG